MPVSGQKTLKQSDRMRTAVSMKLVHESTHGFPASLFSDFHAGTHSRAVEERSRLRFDAATWAVMRTTDGKRAAGNR